MHSFSAKFSKPGKIELLVQDRLDWKHIRFFLYVDGEKLSLTPKLLEEKEGCNRLEFDVLLRLGKDYILEVEGWRQIPVDVSEAVYFPDFDAQYAYDGDDLGFVYSKKSTKFALWAPLASKAFLRLIPKNGQELIREMKRTDRGVFRHEEHGDLDRAKYRYIVINSGKEDEAIDPFGKASTANAEYSAVVDLSSFKEKRAPKPEYSLERKPIIYEGSVRDLTFSPVTNVVNKGRFLGLTEKGRTSAGGHPAGLDYLTYLKPTHIQLLPIYDFKTVDELHPTAGYNWGYDPLQYFLPEGSYSNDPQDPYSRLIEARKLIDTLHQSGLRIVMDVVYNHVYEHLSHPLNRLVPNYFFRRKNNGSFADATGCGNEVASERAMARKLIVDSAKWWISFYGVDGFRFDLMGFLDVETLKEIQDYARGIDPNFLLYGEGWEMGASCPLPTLTKGRADLLPEYGFFSDGFREAAKAYLSGDIGARDAFASSFLDPKDVPLRQSLGYVECHDNHTFYDFLKSKRRDLPKPEILDLVKLGVLASVAFPRYAFLHAGQEFGQTKYGKDNTYNLSDEFNALSYRKLDERFGLATYAKDAILKARQGYFDAPISAEAFEDALLVRFAGIGKYKEILLILNPSEERLTYHFDSDRRLILDPSGDAEQAKIYAQDVLIPKHSAFVYGLE